MTSSEILAVNRPTLGFMASAVCVIATMAGANTGPIRCTLDMECGGCGRTAAVVLDDSGIELSGTHINPDTALREAPRARRFALIEWPFQEMSYSFGDQTTHGMFTMDYGHKAALSLHIASADRAYFETYEGFCEVS